MDFRDGIGHAFIPKVAMRPLHRVLLLVAALTAIHGVQACATETPDPGLNPQPLPPEDQKDNSRGEEAQDPNTGVGGGSTSGSTSSSGGSSGSAPVADGDAGDGGGDSGGDN